MDQVNAIYSRLFESYIWIRPEGRGTFMESGVIKELVKRCQAQGARDFVVDLDACPGMDSTFMGMLAGIAIEFRKSGQGSLAIVGTTEKTRGSLRELGLHHVLVIEPSEGPWVGRLEEARSNLELIDLETTVDREKHILESHEDLCEADEANFGRFKTVLEMLRSDRVTRTE
jgi:anti-anti-sigma regulatory factor